jgi:ribosomal protein S18 acetylase RimI-like enzyme
MEIREFHFDNDLEAVFGLWQDARPGIQTGLSDTPAEIRKKLERDPDLFLVAVDGERLVGSVIGGFDGRRGLVYHLAVAPSHRGNSLGRRLMEELESRLRRKGCLKCYLLVTKDNQQTVDFYEHLGWEIMDLFLMGKVLG